MRKLITLLFTITSLLSYSQTTVSILLVPDSTTAFGMSYPIGRPIMNKQDGKIWISRSTATATSTLATISKQESTSKYDLNKEIADRSTGDAVTLISAKHYADSINTIPSGSYVTKNIDDTILSRKTFIVTKQSTTAISSSPYVYKATIPTLTSGSSSGNYITTIYNGSANQSYGYGITNYLRDSCSGTTGTGIALFNKAYFTHGVVTTGTGLSNQIDYSSSGSFNKLTVTHSILTNSSTNALNNDGYSYAGSIINSGRINQAYGEQLSITNTGTIDSTYGLQITMYNSGGTLKKYYGIDLGCEHKYTGHVDTSIVVGIDKSTNFGTYSRVIKSTSKAQSDFSGLLTYQGINNSALTSLSLVPKKYTDSTFVALTGNQNISGVKTFSDTLKAKGVEATNGILTSGAPSTFPTGNYSAMYYSSTYGARVLGYTGTSYLNLRLGKLVSGSGASAAFQTELNADGTIKLNGIATTKTDSVLYTNSGNITKGAITQYLYPQFSYLPTISNVSTYLNNGATNYKTDVSITSGNSSGMYYGGACNPFIVTNASTLTGATLVLGGAGVQNGTVTYPVTYTAQVWSVGFTTEGTLLGTLTWSISNSYTVGTYSPATTSFIGTTTSSISIPANTMLAVKFIAGSGASNVAETLNSLIKLTIKY